MKYNIKLLVENLFDDDIFDTDINDDLFEEENNKFYEICKETLCQNIQYHYILPEDLEDGFTAIKEDPNEPGILYAGLIGTYKTCNLGPRKRKKYPISSFYKYKITFNDDGSISLYIAYYNNKNLCIFNKPLIDFITKCTFKIKNVIFNKGNSNEVFDEFERIMIIPDNYQKIPDDFVKHFPDDVLPHANKEKQSEFNPSKFYKTSFSSDEMFFTMIKKLINLGYIIKDKSGVVYNEKNIDSLFQFSISGEQDKQLNQQELEKTEFIKNKFGEKYSDKLSKLIDYYNTQYEKKTMYLKYINTLRTENNKINLATTIQKLKEDNNCITPVETEDPAESTPFLVNKIILFKMFFILNNEGLNAYKSDYTLADCIEGVSTYTYYYGETYKYLDINDLPIRIKNLSSIYTLYYVMAKAITQCKDITYDLLNDFRNYSSTQDKKAKEMNFNVNINMNTFNFDFLTNQLKTIIDKTCKKLKIK